MYLDIISQAVNRAELVESIAQYLGLVEGCDAKLDALIESEYKAGVTALEQAMNSTTEQTSLLREARGRFNKAIHLEKNVRLALSYVGLAVCHAQLGDEGNVDLTLRKVIEIDEGSGLFSKLFRGGNELRAIQDSVYGYFGEKSPWMKQSENKEAEYAFFEAQNKFQHETGSDLRSMQRTLRKSFKSLMGVLEYNATKKREMFLEGVVAEKTRIADQIRAATAADDAELRSVASLLVQEFRNTQAKAFASALRELEEQQQRFQSICHHFAYILDHALSLKLSEDTMERAKVERMRSQYLVELECEALRIEAESWEMECQKQKQVHLAANALGHLEQGIAAFQAYVEDTGNTYQARSVGWESEGPQRLHALSGELEEVKREVRAALESLNAEASRVVEFSPDQE